jgi:hypothetical protein
METYGRRKLVSSIYKIDPLMTEAADRRLDFERRRIDEEVKNKTTTELTVYKRVVKSLKQLPSSEVQSDRRSIASHERVRTRI